MPEVRAGGGVVWRRDRNGTVDVLLVHRPRYDDWSFPKGKCEDGESFRAAAEREVWEETGLRCELGEELPDTRYVDHKDRSKVVRYWAMRVVGGVFEPNDEVDEVRWLPVEEAQAVLTYQRDQVVLEGLERVI